MLMTAAGTVPPAKVLVLGAGVAGLQAIATARRLGAVVSAFDTRPAVKEQVLSLGATFVELEMEVGETAQDARGYATVLSESQQVEQQRLLERAHRRLGRRHHDGGRARPAGARLIPARRGRGDAHGLGHRRPGRRDAAATAS